jgi:hypothetical protein
VKAVTVTTMTGRSLAPDRAWGVMSLAIAVAHGPVFVTGTAFGVLDGVAPATITSQSGRRYHRTDRYALQRSRAHDRFG